MDRSRIRGLVVNFFGKMLHQIMYDALNGEDANWLAFIHYWQVPVTAFFHATNGAADRLLGVNGDRIGGHIFGNRRRKRFSWGHHAAHQIALGEDSYHVLPAIAYQNAA